MNHWLKMRWTVARWEFQRYFKWKDQIIGLVSLVLGGIVGFGAVHFARSASGVQLAVLGASSSFAIPEKSKLSLVKGDHTEQEWRAKVESKEIDGLLIISAPTPLENEATPPSHSRWTSQLIVRQEPTWLGELKPLVQSERMQWEMQAAQIEPATLARILEPVDLQLVPLADRSVSTTDRMIAFCVLGAVVVTSWIGLAYLLTGITGEKQLRVTEQIVSAIRPQTWIDGKVLGITFAAIGSWAFLAVASLIALPAAVLLGIEFTMPAALERWEFLPLLMCFYIGGVLFWNCFYAGVASIINDPNTSSRSSLLFLPLLPMIAAGLVSSQPDGSAMRALSLLPGTSSTAMPMRLVLGEVTTVEVLASLVLMILGIAGLRWLAGRIFAAGIMLYGKEPSWLEIANWAIGRRVE